MKLVKKFVSDAQDEFAKRLRKVLDSGGLKKQQYARFLIMQYHLTNGVQKHFFRIVSHSDFTKKKSLRDFLVKFAIEEEMHFELARLDLEALGETMQAASLDVQLWWAFYNSVVDVRPFMRLGGTCILENLAGKAGEILDSLVSNADYMNGKNTRFMQIHRHEILPHGDQIIEILESANLNSEQLSDLVEGTKIATILYLRMFDWVLNGAETY